MNRNTIVTGARHIAVGSLLAIILILYLAPSKNHIADAITASLLFVAVLLNGRLIVVAILPALRPLLPLLVLLAYAFVLGFLRNGSASTGYITSLAIGFLPYFLFYILFRDGRRAHFGILIIAIFIVPGFIHLALMYFDIISGILTGGVPFTSSSKQGLLEYVKNAPRVGRRYLSVVIVHFLFGSFLLRLIHNTPFVRYATAALAVLSVFSLALLDARAAYVSLLLGALLTAVTLDYRILLPALVSWFPRRVWKRVMLAVAAAIIIAVGSNAGLSRWIAVRPSLDAAVYDVFQSSDDIGSRPYVNEAFWRQPIPDVGKCYMDGDFRCKVDQSAYLRVAWFLEGLKSIVEHPFGIGYSKDYMGRLWGVAGEVDRYQRIDGLLVELLVCFGLPGMVLYVAFWWRLGLALRQWQRLPGKPAFPYMSDYMMILCGLIFVCVGRSLVDVFSDGLWGYLMAMVGMYYGLLHSELYDRNGPAIRGPQAVESGIR